MKRVGTLMVKIWEYYFLLRSKNYLAECLYVYIMDCKFERIIEILNFNLFIQSLWSRMIGILMIVYDFAIIQISDKLNQIFRLLLGN